MASSSTRPPVRLPKLQPDDAQPHVCPSNNYLWDEEIDLVRRMRDIKLEVRAARARGDLATVDRLRVEFKEVDARREKIRRERLDSLGCFDYD